MYVIGIVPTYLQFCRIEIDIIIDDASHIPNHQLKTFTEMFRILKNKGIYVIEELDIFQSFDNFRLLSTVCNIIESLIL